jgi:hypothetical protein
MWRIVHRDNLPWILDNGLYGGNSAVRSEQWVTIGNVELIDKRSRHPVPIAPGGFLNDYVPFYFTPFSVMMRNINTGWGGVKRRANEEIVILVSSLYHVKKKMLPYVFTDSHAYYQWSNFYSDLVHLDKIDWRILQNRDFKRDQDDPAKFERYQAEALIHQYCPVDGLLGVVCYTEAMKSQVEKMVEARGLPLKVFARPGWYF